MRSLTASNDTVDSSWAFCSIEQRRRRPLGTVSGKVLYLMQHLDKFRPIVVVAF